MGKEDLQCSLISVSLREHHLSSHIMGIME